MIRVVGCGPFTVSGVLFWELHHRGSRLDPGPANTRSPNLQAKDTVIVPRVCSFLPVFTIDRILTRQGGAHWGEGVS